MTSDNDWLLSLVFFGGIFGGSCLLLSSVKFNGRSQPLACLLEDAPQKALNGQFYELATPLLTPLACLLEDAPQSAFRGQCCELATPLACLYPLGWRAYYRQHLASSGIHYWQWKDKPFAEDVCPALTQLMSLPEPAIAVRLALESLPSHPPPLWNWEILIAFRQWHQTTCHQIGLNALQTIYQACYGTNWAAIAPLVEESQPPTALYPALLKVSAPWWQVFRVGLFASSWQVEQAYKTLIRQWHPDCNPHLLATQIASRLNRAYTQYQKHQQVISIFLHPFKSVKSWLMTQARG